MPISAIIVDDEALARERMRGLLAEHADVEITSEFASAAAARDFLERQHPDVVFLDVQLGDRSGLGIANMAAAGETPMVVFTTAYSEYAVQAFESRAIDYIVKPVEPARLREALDRVRQRLRMSVTARQSSPRPSGSPRIAVPAGGRSMLIRLSDVDWIEAVGNYVKIHLGEHAYIVRSALYTFEKRLDPAEFVRIHRRFIVNVARVKEIGKGIRRGEHLLKLDGGTTLPMQRAYSQALREAIGRF
jgi:two-component system LytT family response regulator